MEPTAPTCNYAELDVFFRQELERRSWNLLHPQPSLRPHRRLPLISTKSSLYTRKPLPK